MVLFALDPRNPPQLTGAERARLDRMTDAEITAAALSDNELARIRAARRVREVRPHSGLSQVRFAETYRST
ncbi:MAG: hypothetical protein M0Z28_31235 [Rhodospirillales bacterium]|nr:hypothetical protein [Rhodospirillales bacterium]